MGLRKIYLTGSSIAAEERGHSFQRLPLVRFRESLFSVRKGLVELSYSGVFRDSESAAEHARARHSWRLIGPEYSGLAMPGVFCVNLAEMAIVRGSESTSINPKDIISLGWVVFEKALTKDQLYQWHGHGMSYTDEINLRPKKQEKYEGCHPGPLSHTR